MSWWASRKALRLQVQTLTSEVAYFRHRAEQFHQAFVEQRDRKPTQRLSKCENHGTSGPAPHWTCPECMIVISEGMDRMNAEIDTLTEASFAQEQIIENLTAQVQAERDKYQRDVHGLNNEGDPIGGEPAGGYLARIRSLDGKLKSACKLLGAVTMPGTDWQEDVNAFLYREPDRARLDQIQAILDQHGTMTGDTTEQDVERLTDELEDLQAKPECK